VVTPLGPQPTPLTVVPLTRPADADVLLALDSMRDLAADGRLVAIAIAAVHRDGAIATAYVKGEHVFALLGAIAHTARRLHDSVEE
jgi:hypothetical protein